MYKRQVRGLTAGGTGGISAAKSAGLTDKERVVINEKRFGASPVCVSGADGSGGLQRQDKGNAKGDGVRGLSLIHI